MRSRSMKALPTLALLVSFITLPLTEAGVDPWQDSDRDLVSLATDNCPGVNNPEQLDFDGDGIGDSCDVTTFMIGNQAPATLILRAPTGSPPQTVSIAQVSNRTPGAVPWSASGTSGLLGVPQSGFVPQGANGQIFVTYGAGGRPPGVYNDTVHLTVNGESFTSNVALHVMGGNWRTGDSAASVEDPARVSPEAGASAKRSGVAGRPASIVSPSCPFTVFLDRIELVGPVADGGPDMELQLIDSVYWNSTTYAQAWPYFDMGWYVLAKEGVVEPGLVLMTGSTPRGNYVSLPVTTDAWEYDAEGTRGYVGADNLTAQFSCNSAGTWTESEWITEIPYGAAMIYVTTRVQWR